MPTRSTRSRSRSRSRQQQPPQPIGGLAWFLIVLILGLIAKLVCANLGIGLPLMPIIWLALLMGAATKRYPPKPAGAKSEPDPKKLASYEEWKDYLAGLKPSRKYWLDCKRVAWWAGLPVGLAVSIGAPLLPTIVNILFAFMVCMSIAYRRDRASSRLHPRWIVSIPSFFKKASTGKRVAVCALTVLAGIVTTLVTVAMHAGWQLPVAVTSATFLIGVYLCDHARQQAGWKDIVRWQDTFDKWIKSPELAKAYPKVYVSKVSKAGDPSNPLTVIKFKVNSVAVDEQTGQPLPASAENAAKLGVAPFLPLAQQAGYDFVSLLNAWGRGGTFAPNTLRLVVGRNRDAVPDITGKNVNVKLAQLVMDIAYANAALVWGKRAPLTKVVDVSDDPDHAAWLVTFTNPQRGGDTLRRIGLEWVAEPTSNPQLYSGLPVYTDIEDAFHLHAQDGTLLSDKGNKYRPRGALTSCDSFQQYIDLSKRYKTESFAWKDIVGTKLPIPQPNYDREEEKEYPGWMLRITPMLIEAPASVSDYVRYPLESVAPGAKFVGVAEPSGQPVLVAGYGDVPSRLDKLTGTDMSVRKYAQAVVLKALVGILPSKGGVVIEGCSQETKTHSVWRVRILLTGGATMSDIRKHTAQIAAATGATHVYVDWEAADKGVVWLTGDPMLDVRDINEWKRRSSQKELIELSLSDAWGVAGVADNEGKAPQTVSLGTLPSNPDVLLARFRIAGGLRIDSPKNNLDKFLTEADYMYGRILPRGDEHGARDFDMVLAKHSPFPRTAKPDWDQARKLDNRKFLLGVDDMGEQVLWNLKTSPHLLIEGKSGTGKSSAMMNAVAQAFLHGGKVLLIDPSKGCVDFTQWAKPRSVAFVGVNQMRETEAALAWAVEEMKTRVAINSKYGVGNIYDLDPEQVDEEDRKHLYQLFIGFDEFNSYLGKAGKTQSNPNHDVKLANENAQVSATNTSISRAMSSLAEIGTQGRTAAVHLILGAQRLGMKDMEPYNGGALMRSTARILLGTDTCAGVITQPNVSEANRLQKQLKGAGGTIPSGRGLFETMDGTLSAVQTYYYSSDQADFTSLVSDVPEREPIDLTPYLPKEAESFGEMSQESIQEEIARAEANDAADAAALAELFGMGGDDDEEDFETIEI